MADGGATFTLTFKTLGELTGLNSLMNGVRTAAGQVQQINEQIRSVASTATTALSAAAGFLAVEKLTEYAKMASEAQEKQAGFTYQVLRSRDGTQEFLQELNKLNKEMQTTMDVSLSTSRGIESQLLLYGATREQVLQLTPAIINFAAATNRTATEVGDLIARKIRGNADDAAISLQRLGLRSKDIAGLGVEMAALGGDAARVKAEADGGMTAFSQRVTQLQIAIGNIVNLVRVPFLNQLMNSLGGAKQGADDLAKSTGGLGERIFVISGIVGNFIGQNGNLVASLVGVAGGLLLVRTALLALGGPLTLIVAALGAWGYALSRADDGASTFSQNVQRMVLFVQFAYNEIKRLTLTIAGEIGGGVATLLAAAWPKIQEWANKIANVLQFINPLAASGLRTAVSAASLLGLASPEEIDREKDAEIAAVNRAADQVKDNILKRAAEIEAEIARRKASGQSTTSLEDELKSTFEKMVNFSKDMQVPKAPAFAASVAPEKAATDALTQAKFGLSTAEQNYQQQLKITQLLEEHGDITAEEATTRRHQSAQDFIAALQQLQSILPGVIAQLDKVGDVHGAAEARQELQRINAEALQLKITASDNTFFGGMIAGVRQLAVEWGNTAKQISGFLAGSMQTAIGGVSNALTAVIFKTGNWKQAFAQAAQSIVQNLIQIVLQWVIGRTILAALNRAFGSADTAAANAQAAASAAAWAPAATSASIASYGVAAGVGTAAYLAALAAGTSGAVAASQIGGVAGGGFAKGGFTGSGADHEVAGPAHKNEFVMSSLATRALGVPLLQKLHSAALRGSNFLKRLRGYAVGGLVDPDLPPSAEPYYGTKTYSSDPIGPRVFVTSPDGTMVPWFPGFTAGGSLDKNPFGGAVASGALVPSNPPTANEGGRFIENWGSGLLGGDSPWGIFGAPAGATSVGFQNPQGTLSTPIATYWGPGNPASSDYVPTAGAVTGSGDTGGFSSGFNIGNAGGFAATAAAANWNTMYGTTGFGGLLGHMLMKFANGGFTGGMMGKIAGFVHGKEFVFSAPAVDSLGVGFLTNLHDVALTKPTTGFERGGFVGAGGGSDAGGSMMRPQIHIFNFTDPDKLRDAVLNSSAAYKMIVDTVNDNRVELGI